MTPLLRFLPLFLAALASAQALRAYSGTVPGGLPSHFAIGTQNFPGAPGNRAWMDATRLSHNADWDYRYTYFNAGANTGFGWSTWNSPAGQYASLYMSDSDAGGYIPVLIYYQILQSNPATGADESAKDYNNLNNTSTMNAYYADFKLLLQRAAAFNKPVIVHIEPDLFGYIQKDHSGGTNNAANCAASVASSGHADVAGLPNTFQGYCRALRKLRDTYAPQARLAVHLSMWASGQDLMANSSLSQASINTEADKTIAFLNSCDSGAEGKFDLFFFEFSDRDASYKWSQGNTTYWWSDVATNIGGAPTTFTRHRYILDRVSAGIGKRGMGWQVPVGNTVYQTCNNSTKHWRSPFAQGILEGYSGPLAASRIKDYADAGVIGMLFGAGQADQTHPWDDAGDGVTNGGNVANYGSTQGSTVSTLSDDDGGYLRIRVGNYYTQGVYPLSGAPTPTPTATPSPAFSATPTPSPTPDCPRLLNGAETLTENGSWAGANATRSIDTVQGAAITQGSASLRVQVTTATAWWNEGLANLSGFTPNVLSPYNAISFDLYADPGSPPWTGGATVRNIAVHANVASLGKWSQPITADAPLVAGLNRITLPFNYALGTVVATDAISTLQFNLKVDAPSTGVFHLDNIVLHTGTACPPSPTPSPTRTSTRTPSSTPSPSPTRSATASASPSATPSASATASPTASSTRTASASPSATGTATRSASPTPTPSATGTWSATGSPTWTATLTASRTSTLTVSSTPTLTASPSFTPTPTASPTGSPTASPSASRTATPTATPSPTGSRTPTPSPSFTATPTASPSATRSATPTASASVTASASATPTATLSPVLSPTATATASLTWTSTATPTETATLTATSTLTPSPSATPSGTPSETPSPSATATPSGTPSGTPSPSATATPSFSATPVWTATPTWTVSPVLSATGTPTDTATPTATGTDTPTPSPSWTWSPAPSETASMTASPTLTASVTVTPSASATTTSTPAGSASPTTTPTGSASTTITPTRSPSSTTTPTGTRTAGTSATQTVTPAAAAAGVAQGGRLLQALAFPNPQSVAALRSGGLRLALKVEGQPRWVRAAIYTRAMVRVGGWEQALPVDGSAVSWKRAQSAPLDLAAGAYFARLEADGSEVLCRFVVLP